MEIYRNYKAINIIDSKEDMMYTVISWIGDGERDLNLRFNRPNLQWVGAQVQLRIATGKMSLDYHKGTEMSG